MYFTSSIGDAIRIPLRLTLSLLSCFSIGVVQLIGAAPMTNPPSQRSSTPGSISRRLRSSSPPPTAKSAGASSPTNQSRWDRHGLAKEVVHLLHLFFALHVIYIVHWAQVVTWNTISFSYYMTSSEVPGNLAIRDGLSWMPSLFISVCLSYAFVDGPWSWASRAVAWVQCSRSRTKTFFECRLFLAQACLLESPVLERKSEVKT